MWVEAVKVKNEGIKLFPYSVDSVVGSDNPKNTPLFFY